MLYGMKEMNKRKRNLETKMKHFRNGSFLYMKSQRQNSVISLLKTVREDCLLGERVVSELCAEVREIMRN